MNNWNTYSENKNGGVTNENRNDAERYKAESNKMLHQINGGIREGYYTQAQRGKGENQYIELTYINNTGEHLPPFTYFFTIEELFKLKK